MKKILFIFFILFFHIAEGSERLSVTFGKQFISLPGPSNFCILGQTPEEVAYFAWKRDILLKTGNKLFGVWIKCEVKKEIQANKLPKYFKEYVEISAILSGDLMIEQTFQMDPQEFKDLLVGDMDISKIAEQTNKIIKGENLKHFKDEEFVTVTEPIDLGVLAVTDSVHRGIIMKVSDADNERVVAGVGGTILLKGVPLSVNFYAEYRDKETIKKLLSKSKLYSAKLFYAN